MVQSSEFIKGYTEIVVCALLFERDDYLYSLVKRITECGGGEIRITNPSLLMVMKRLLEEGKIKSYSGESRTGMDRRYYSLTEKGREYYLLSREAYLGTLRTLKNLIQGGRSQ